MNRKIIVQSLLLLFILSISTPNNGTIGAATNNNTSTLGLNNTINSPNKMNSIGKPIERSLNASIISMARNVTIQPNSNVQLHDDMSLKIYDNVSSITYFNYTIPTAFDQYVNSAHFYSRYSTKLAITTSTYERTYTKYSGANFTTYSFSIASNQTSANPIPANSSIDVIYIEALLNTINTITFSLSGQQQVGKFDSPLFPRFYNLPVHNCTVGIALLSEADLFQTTQIPPFSNPDNPSATYPISVSSGKILQWLDFSESPLSGVTSLKKYVDMIPLTFISNPPVSGSIEQSKAVTNFAFPELLSVVRIDPWGKVYVKQTITIMGLNAPRPSVKNIEYLNFEINTYDFVISKYATVTAVFDSQGKLNIGTLSNDKPRTTLSPGSSNILLAVNFRNGIYYHENYTFSVEYAFNSSDVISVQGGRQILNTTLFSLYNTTAYHLDSIYQLPSGAQFIQSTFTPHGTNSIVEQRTYSTRKTLSFFNNLNYEISIDNPSFQDNHQFQIIYKSSILGYFDYIIIYFMFFVLLLALTQLYKEFKTEPKSFVNIEKENIPVAEIETFFNLFREKSGATKRITDLQDKRRKNKITQKDYTGQVKAIQKRVREITPQLNNATKQLSDKGTKYERLVSRVIISNQKQEDIRNNMNSARRSYSKGLTTKDNFQKLMRDYQMTYDKEETKINKSLTELLELIQQYT